MPQRIIDTHVHTDNSPDGHHSAMYMCECAEMAGLRAIAFTDHVEADFYRRDHYDRVALQSFIDVTKARSAFRGKLLVCAGVELGQPMYDVATSEEILANLPYDMVIGSVHNFQNEQDFMYLDYSQWDITDLMNKYFDELIKLARWAKFDTLAHMTYPLRYIVGEHGISVDMSKFSDKVDEILSLLVKNEKALEINTSGLRQKLGKTMPEEDVVRRFKQLGGEFVTVGSARAAARRDRRLGRPLCKGYRRGSRCRHGDSAAQRIRLRDAVPEPTARADSDRVKREVQS